MVGLYQVIQRYLMVPDKFALLPERIFVANRRWVEGKALCIANGSIVSITEPSRLPKKQKIIELPGQALLPGLVNAHAHLEYTDASFRKPVRPSFVSWLDAIKSWKEKRTSKDVSHSLRRGVDELLKTGVVAVGDHYCGQGVPRELIRSPLKGVVFHEVMGINPAKALDFLNAVKKRATQFPEAAVRFGLALHAPYTVSQPLVRKMLAWTKTRKIPVSMHIGESREEGMLFDATDSALQRWLKEITGVTVASGGKDLFAYLGTLGIWRTRIQAVHMNLARQRHLRWLYPNRLTIAYCPKSHEYFRHPRFGLETFLRRGYCVALGTDSLASNDALNMWEELRMARSLHPSVSLGKLWDMATIHGARSLGLEKSGPIRPGYRANLVGIPASCTRHPLEEVFRHAGKVVFSMIEGKVASGALNC